MRTVARLAALLSAILMLGGLCGCAAEWTDRSEPVGGNIRPSGQPPEGETDMWGDAFFTAATTAASGFAYRAGVWDSDLLPAEFPQPVPVTTELFTLHDESSQLLGTDPCESWILSLEVTAAQWTLLDDAFADAGWVGGGTDLARTHATEVDGAWLSGQHYAYVYRGDYDAGTWTYSVQIAVFRREAPRVSAELDGYFPTFTAGYTHTGGDRTEDIFTGEIRWVFGGAGRFVGVTAAAVDLYRQTLTDSGFTVSDRDDFGNHWIAAGASGDVPLQVEALFDADCRTLELIYTINRAE